MICWLIVIVTEIALGGLTRKILINLNKQVLMARLDFLRVRDIIGDLEFWNYGSVYTPKVFSFKSLKFSAWYKQGEMELLGLQDC